MKQVLYLEENEQNLLLVRRVLQAQGCACHAAADAQIAWLAAEQHQFDLIMVEMSLPGAVAWVSQLKQTPALSHIPILAIVPSAADPLREQAYLAGCEAFLAKPADIRQIRAVVDECLNLHQPTLFAEERLATFTAAY